jgi:hypothetical protein
MLPTDANEALSPAERRTYDRKKLIVEVKFAGGDTTGIANSRDIGIGGLYLSTKTHLESGLQMVMKLFLDGKEAEISGVVVYSDPGHGVGVRFQNLNEEAESLLKAELGIKD